MALEKKNWVHKIEFILDFQKYINSDQIYVYTHTNIWLNIS